jgi:hypothetical protein
MSQGLELTITLAHPYILMPHLLFSPYLLPYTWTKKKRRIKKGESEKGKGKWEAIPGS